MHNAHELVVLEAHSDAIKRFVFDEYFTLHPDKIAWRNDPKIKAICQDDIAKHLSFLVSALERDSEIQFINYCLWLRGVFQSRDIPLAHFTDGLVLLRRFCAESGQGLSKSLFYLDQALAALADDSRSLTIVDTCTQPDIPRTESYLSAVLRGQSRDAWEGLQQAINSDLSYSAIGTRIIQPAMYQVGSLWETNKITVAQEHLASSITQNTLAKTLAFVEYETPNDRMALFSCVEGNHHVIGLRIVADSFEIAGWDTTFLGANTPSGDIIAMVREIKPELLGLSVALTQQLPTLKALTDDIHREFGADRPFILVGGLATNQLGGMLDNIQVDQWIPHAQAVSTDLKI
ncbi:cobalamin B12-binding domain-containing protein [Simiduia aestuariiviva]|uniref:Methanogenic corrinoid protein MtbC1 n=1 Tax=Simiduia aestuariiviva TaxID=1510459 RepID=A0A839UHW6_9GAMM|nr:cobalamin-dependent protein [Simiduia aestuariiviva]MBB3167624.1 methanogenic corrinoid protein MtbC1 [Simiduia aestuariiviva]